MRTALAASVAAVAKWTFVAAPLGLQAVPKRQSVWSRAAGTRFARPVLQPESRHIDSPEQGQVYAEILLIREPPLQPLPNGFLWLLLWGCRLFRNGSLCGQGQPEQALPEQGQVYVESLLIMRTALAASVAAAAKWTFVAAPLGLQAVPERQSVWSRAAGTRFARPVPQPESRHIDLPEQEQRETALCAP